MKSAFPFSVLLLASIVMSQSAFAQERDLFDGKTLNGWSGHSQLWSVQDGAIVGKTTKDAPIKANTFLMLNDVEVGDFEFRCQFRFAGNNSGVQYRSKVVDEAGFALAGYQADLHPRADFLGMMYSERTGRGILAKGGQRIMVPKAGKAKVTATFGAIDAPNLEGWNELRIIAVGNRMVHQVNGQTTIDLTDNHANAATTGRLGLQLHRGPAMTCEFKALKLSPLTKEEGQKLIEAAASEVSSNPPHQAPAPKKRKQPAK
ncbi:MAG: DUF1080 domain-containing protein [Fuerstiella sp.]